MKALFSIALIMALLNPNLAEIRKAYPTAANSENSAIEFVEKMAAVDAVDNKTLVAYKGASLAMASKYKKKIADKISALKEGGKLIEAAVSAEPGNIEIRMIRLSIQENVPAITGYKKNIAEDKALILKNYKQQDEPLKSYLKNFILKAKSFSAEEKQSAKS